MSIFRRINDMSVLADAKRSYMRASDRRAQILACARDVFARRGFHVTSIADICEAARIGRGTLYQYFGNKHDVFLAVVEELAARVGGVLAERPKIDDIQGAEQVPPALALAFCEKRLREMLQTVFADEATLRLLMREARVLDGGIDAVVRRVDEVVLGALEEDLAAAHRLGVIECADPRRTALFVLGGVEKMVVAALESDEPLDLEAIVKVATRIQLFGLLSERTLRRDVPGGGGT
jgi:TetR/AcrR family fatty acid metabolism transcriptional regulator